MTAEELVERFASQWKHDPESHSWESPEIPVQLDPTTDYLAEVLPDGTVVVRKAR